MPDRPLLPLPQPTRQPRPIRRGGGGGELRLPSRPRQRDRVAPRIKELEEVFSQRRAALEQRVAGAPPEEVLVLEVAGGIDDFITAIRHTPGMQWLVESDDFEAEADDDFSRDEEHRDAAYSARLYLVMANQQAIEQLLRLWEQWGKEVDESGQKWRRGQTKWRDLFDHLHDIRWWGAQDRLEDTGLLEDWRERVRADAERVPVEAELWFRDVEGARQAAEEEIRRIVEEDGGRLVGQCTVPEIRYHAVLAEVPIATAQRIIEQPDAAIVQSRQVMFLRPVGQVAVPRGDDERSNYDEAIEGGTPDTEPVVALLDGLPLVNHELLASRVILDDPDGWEATYQAQDRRHGTGMASIIVHGDLSQREEPLSTPVYARPIMRPVPGLHDAVETMPEDELAVDLIHRAVRRMLDPSAGGPAAPTVRVINHSVCDAARPFDKYMSSWARLLDWLSWKYNVMWVVSAGNCDRPLELAVNPGDAETLTEDDRVHALIHSIWQDSFNRRILAPSEAINALTASAVHRDGSGAVLPTEFPTYPDTIDYPSPLNPLGLGYRRSVKPEVLITGGRQPYRRTGIGELPVALEVMRSNRAPGIQVACPGTAPGDLRATHHTRGTSNAAAMVSRLAGQVHHMLGQVPAETGGVPDEFRTVTTKALITHAARWNDSREQIVDVVGSEHARAQIPRFLGYGIVDERRALSATDQRATLVGWGRLGEDESDLFSLPIPPSLSGRVCLRRLVVTLAWLTPVKASSRKYRVAALQIDPEDATDLRTIAVNRREADNRLVSRGTVQHEVFEGEQATVFTDGDNIRFRVSCRADAASFEEGIPYGVAITIEVAEEIGIPIYDEIQARIRAFVPVVVRG